MERLALKLAGKSRTRLGFESVLLINDLDAFGSLRLLRRRQWLAQPRVPSGFSHSSAEVLRCPGGPQCLSTDFGRKPCLATTSWNIECLRSGRLVVLTA